MVNSEEFSARLQLIMQQHDLNASSFAEKINVGRSSISHILSGRNKPSLDFVLAVLKTFDDVDLYWLLNGKGSYPKKQNTTPELIDDSTPVSSENSKALPPPIQQESPSQNTEKTENKPSFINNNKGKNISKVILIYDDGTFENFIP
jgi:transcriptional regulator with XRE-family HTH domain